MDSKSLLYIILGILSFDFILEQVLDYLNLKHQKNDLPEELKNLYTEEEFKKAQDYFTANAKFSFVSSTLSFLLIITVILTGTFGWLDKQLSLKFHNPTSLALVFFGILFLFSDIINIPFSLYKTFVIEEKFGFNKTAIKTYILDKLKGYLLGGLLGGLLIWLFIFMVTSIGPGFWLYFWIILSVVMLVINMFYTSIFVPLFNKLTPLESGELRNSIEEYSKTNNFSITNIFVIDGSKRSSKANAFFSGIGPKKKVVLYDTLINNHTKEELVAVLAHEIGHFKKKHIITGLILGIIQAGFMLFLLSYFIFNTNLSEALGADHLAIHINLIAFGILYTPISHITGLVMNIISRKNEYEADRFAAVTYSSIALQEALKKLSTKNLSNLTPHPAYVFMHYSHPPLLYRLRALKQVQ
ncbi:M48 family metallopeptidase [Sporocytophaga myxococcoides]|uniref:M48 family metallopeptidase n=1 Tax=Sporocytophaga myxococcoides TaxID=153721 RepID=UPI000413C324|nr:M48 family metallopeptidase [Sporocytophaga myxococcoides]